VSEQRIVEQFVPLLSLGGVVVEKDVFEDSRGLGVVVVL
jgi:hypothetical protein